MATQNNTFTLNSGHQVVANLLPGTNAQHPKYQGLMIARWQQELQSQMNEICLAVIETSIIALNNEADPLAATSSELEKASAPAAPPIENDKKGKFVQTSFWLKDLKLKVSTPEKSKNASRIALSGALYCQGKSGKGVGAETKLAQITYTTTFAPAKQARDQKREGTPDSLLLAGTGTSKTSMTNKPSVGGSSVMSFATSNAGLSAFSNASSVPQTAAGPNSVSTFSGTSGSIKTGN